MKKVISVLSITMLLICGVFVLPDDAVATTEGISEEFVTEIDSEESTVTKVYSEESAAIVHSNTSEIGIYADEACESELDYIDVDKYGIEANKSKEAEETCFYIKYPKGGTLQYKAGSRHMADIGADEYGDGGTSYTFWRMESPDDGATSYYNYDENNTPIVEAALTGEFDELTKHLDNIYDYIKIENVTVDQDATYSLKKVSFKAKDAANEFRGSEDFLFMFSLSEDWENAKKLELTYGIEIEYDPSAISAVDTAANAFYDVCNIERDPWMTEVGTAQDGAKKVFLPNLGSLSTGRSDLRHGIGSELWIDINDGYQITRIHDTIGQTELPYTASLISYFKVYDRNGNEVKIETLPEDDRWWGMSYIGSGEGDEILASAYTTEQTLAKGTATNSWTSRDESWKDFSVGHEDTGEFYTWCKEKGYTSELMGTHLIYRVYMPVEKQCKIKIETAEASNISSFVSGDSETDVRYNGTIDGFKSNKVDLSDAYKEAVNEKLKNYYADGVGLIDVYEFDGEIKGAANIAIPMANAKDYEIVWLAEENENDEGASELTPVPMLSVETAADDAKVMPVGHFSKYAVVGAEDDEEEPTEPPTTTTESPIASTELTEPTTPENDDNTDTGDSFNIMPWLILATVAAIGAVTITSRKKI